MRSELNEILTKNGAQALFLYSESFQDVNMYYLTKFLGPDPFILLKKVDQDPILIIDQMEYPRARKESIVKDVRSFEDYNFLEIVKSAPDANIGMMKFIATVANKELGSGTKTYVPINMSPLSNLT